MKTLWETRKFGKFSISEELIDSDPDFVHNVMGQCIILRAENKYIERHVVYEAYCPHFDSINLGEVIPEYEWFCDEKAEPTRHIYPRRI
jgi:hypothetical protein